MNGKVNEHLKEENLKNISERCNNIISSLSKRVKQGYSYAITISKLLGLKTCINSKAIIALYMPERENLYSFYDKEKDKKTETDKRHLQVLQAMKLAAHLRLTFSDQPIVGYSVIKVLVASIVKGKNLKNLGMTDFKPVYSNDDVPWPKK